jgi:membrane-bound ClpP family serine protease
MRKSKLVELKNSLQSKILRIVIPSAIFSFVVVALCGYGMSQEIINPQYLFVILITFMVLSIGFTFYKVQAEIKLVSLNCLSCNDVFPFDSIDTIIESNICSKCNKQAFDE